MAGLADHRFHLLRPFVIIGKCKQSLAKVGPDGIHLGVDGTSNQICGLGRDHRPTLVPDPYQAHLGCQHPLLVGRAHRPRGWTKAARSNAKADRASSKAEVPARAALSQAILERECPRSWRSQLPKASHSLVSTFLQLTPS